MTEDASDPLIIRFMALVKARGEREIMKALMDTPIDLGYAEKLVSGRSSARPRGTNRNILEAFVQAHEIAS